MLKTLLATLSVVVLLVAIAPSAHSGVDPFVQYWNTSDFGSGWGIGVKGHRAIVPMVGIDTRLQWVQFNDGNMFPIEAAVMFRPPVVYGGLGVGYYIFDHDRYKMDNSFGWFIVAGGRFVPFGIVGVFGELRWTFLDTEIEIDGQKFSRDIDGIGVAAGIVINIF